jgi:transcriptional regulator with XRE-family HTH domain
MFGQALEGALSPRSQAWLAKAVGRDQGAVSKWINGRNEPDVDTVFAIERVLAVPPGELSRHLGYVPVETSEIVSVVAAVESDSRLDARMRRALISAYRSFTESADSVST